MYNKFSFGKNNKKLSKKLTYYLERKFCYEKENYIYYTFFCFTYKFNSNFISRKCRYWNIRWGYYNGSVDGIYGSQTVAAVKKFQQKNGLTVDGIAGQNTLAAMGITSNSSSASSSSNSANLDLLARLIYGEARGEPYTGQVAVAAVVLNRVKNSSFPNTISGVIYQSGAFDVVADGQINMTPNSTARKAAQDALNGWDPTYGAIYYFNPNTATNKWIWSRPMTVTIGKHRFCK